ncbi:hypothetical protein [Sagittula stellata]|uniref:Uncharacterized protein n=1 Tax=Sagittula stellata (strain ATCC 700073 / DSM 11524 / E-37) TaxID=388399 RepID=A3KA87_SAGS3|nr:hypothetical protein [Sagittula stellata]EBA05878.1 hypothetical protein SSE37_15678 [Sagittula stellata E-37]
MTQTTDTDDPSKRLLESRLLAQSARNLVNASFSFDILLERLVESLSTVNGWETNSTGIAAESRARDRWVTPSLTRNVEISEKKNGGGRKRKIGTVSFTIRLCDDAESNADDVKKANLPWQDLACLFVGFHWVDKAKSDTWSGADYSARNSDHLKHSPGHGLWCWWDGQAWGNFFAIPLGEMRKECHIENYVLTPLKTLNAHGLDAKTAKTALGGVPALQRPE